MAADFWNELLQATAAVTLAMLFVLCARRPVRRGFGARAAYALWAAVPLSMLAVWLPPLMSSSGTIAVALPATWTQLPASLVTATSAPSPQAWIAIWLFGATSFAIVLAMRQRRFLGRVRRREGEAHDESDWSTPAVFGLLRPRIVLPADFRQRYTPLEQELVLAHESLHVARGDIPAQTLATLLRCLFWFHPLVHWSAARFRFDQELACDADVIRRYPQSRRSYGDAMLKTQLAGFGLPLGCHWQSIHPFKERIAMLKQPLPGTLRRRTGAALLALALSATAFAAWAGQPANLPASDAARPLQAATDADVLTAPQYPAQAKADGVSGRVVLDVLVGVDGRPVEVKVIESNPAGVFDAVAVDAAKQWQFNAGRKGAAGEKVEGWVRVPVDFRADQDAAE